jgi:tripartite ATP-independent transporter DctM subunit
MKLVDLPKVFLATAKSTAVVMFIVGAASAVGWFITVAQIPVKIADLLGGFMQTPLVLLLLINVFFLVIGMIMDLTPNLLIFGPVFLPVIRQAGIDPYFFALLMVLNLCIGLITPPVGTILYLGCGMADVKLGKLTKGILPFLITELGILLLYILVPDVILIPLRAIAG